MDVGELNPADNATMLNPEGENDGGDPQRGLESSDPDNEGAVRSSTSLPPPAVCDDAESATHPLNAAGIFLDSSDDDDSGILSTTGGKSDTKFRNRTKKARRVALNDSDSDSDIPSNVAPGPELISDTDGQNGPANADKSMLDSSDDDDVTAAQIPSSFSGKVKSSKKHRVVDSSDSEMDLDESHRDRSDTEDVGRKTENLSSDDDDVELSGELEADNEELAEVLKSNGSSKPRKERKSKKAAMEEIQHIHSESQRLVRESALNIPYHKPKKMSLTDFLNSRKNKTNALLPATATKLRLPPRILPQKSETTTGSQSAAGLTESPSQKDKPYSQESLTMETDDLTLADHRRDPEESQPDATRSQNSTENVTSGYGSGRSPEDDVGGPQCSQQSQRADNRLKKRCDKYKGLLELNSLPLLNPTLRKSDAAADDCIDLNSAPVNTDLEKFRKRFLKHADMEKKTKVVREKTTESKTADDETGTAVRGAVWCKYKQQLHRGINAQKHERWLRKKQQADIENEIMGGEEEEEEEEMSGSDDEDDDAESGDEDKDEMMHEIDEGTMSSRTGSVNTDDSAFKTPARPFKPIASGTPLPVVTGVVNNGSCRTLDAFDSNSEQTADSTLSRSTDGGSYSLRGLFKDNNSSSSRPLLEHHNSSDMFTNGSLEQEPDSCASTAAASKLGANDDDSSFEMIGSVISAYQPGGGMRRQRDEEFTPFSRLMSAADDKHGSGAEKGSATSTELNSMALPIENSQWFYGDSTQDTMVSPPPVGALGFRFPINNDESQSQLLDANGLLNLSSEDKTSPKCQDLVDDSQTNIDELLDLCSGNFTTQKPAEAKEKPTMSGILSTHLVSSQDNMDELLGLCSGKWGEEVAPLAPRDVVKEESSMSLKLESDDDEDEDGESDEERVHDADVESDESEIEIGLKQKRKRKHKARVSEDDEEDDDDEDDDGATRDSIYDEEFDIVSKEKRRRLAGFFEGEAELSGSDRGSEDEDDNSDLDKLDPEMINENLPSDEEMRSQIGRFHMKKLMDEDASDIRLYKEMLLQDGDLHGDGKTRQRQFRWRAAGEGDEVEPSVPDAGSDDDDPDDGARGAPVTTAPPDDWRKVRHERELWLEEQKRLDRESDKSPFHDKNPALKISRPNFRQKQVPLVQVSPLRQQNDKFKQTVLNRGSFLSRNKGTLFKLAENIRPAPANATSAVTSARGFVFQTVSPRHVDDKKQQKKPATKTPLDTPTRPKQKAKTHPRKPMASSANSKLFQHLEVPL